MRSPVKLDLVGDRGVAFSDSIQRIGVDLTGATFRMHIRLYPDAPGAPIASLSTGAGIFLYYAGSALVSAHITAGRLTTDIYNDTNPTTAAKYAPGDTVAFTELRLGISATAMSGQPTGLIPFPPSPLSPTGERGDDWVGAYDLFIDPDGAGSTTEDKWYYGDFTVRGSATQ